MINNFIRYFAKKSGNFEFILSNNSENIDKSLFYFKDNNFNIILNYLETIFGINILLRNIFESYGKNINHIGVDFGTDRYKFYISLYNQNFKDSLKIIKSCKDILGLKEKYFLEKDFLKFDCIGFDISKNGIQMKIYELIKLDNNFNLLPDYINKLDIKEIGYLKDFNGRKKKFFRFGNYQKIDIFKHDFDIKNFENFLDEVKDLYKIENKVKYFCIEGDKKEIYIY